MKTIAKAQFLRIIAPIIIISGLITVVTIFMLFGAGLVSALGGAILAAGYIGALCTVVNGIWRGNYKGVLIQFVIVMVFGFLFFQFMRQRISQYVELRKYEKQFSNFNFNNYSESFSDFNLRHTNLKEFEKSCKPYIRRKAIVIDTDREKISKLNIDIFRSDGPIALNPEEIGTVILLNSGKELVGHYAKPGMTKLKSADAYRTVCALKIIDTKEERMVGFKLFSSEPPIISSGWEDRKGEVPYKEIVDYILSLPIVRGDNSVDAKIGTAAN